MSVNDYNQNTDKAEEFAFTTDAVTYILAAADCPKKYRDYIDCLIGIANGKVEFDASDTQIERHRNINKPINPNASKKEWAKGRRTELLKWQKTSDLKLFDHQPAPYDKTTKSRPPSHFKLHLVEYIQQVITEAKKNTFLWSNNPSIALKQAAQNFVNGLRTQPKDQPVKDDDYIDPPHEVTMRLRAAKTNIAEALAMLKRYDFQLPDVDEDLMIDLEKLLTEIRNRGFADILTMKVFQNIKRRAKPKP